MSKKSKRETLRQRHAPRSPWPFVLMGGGVLLAALVAFAVWQATAPGAGPKVPVEVKGAPSIKVDKDEVDLGRVKLGQTVEVTFNVANVGDKQLRFAETPYVELVEGC
jgi:hypothetical protein